MRIETHFSHTLDTRARRAAKRIGLIARKTCWRRGTCDNIGGFQLIDPFRNAVVGGERFDLTPEEVIAFRGD